MTARLTRVMLISMLLVFSTACAIKPRRPPDAVQAPDRFRHASKTADGVRADMPDSAWWTQFNDPTLDTLQRRLSLDNETLKAASARVAAAAAAVQGQAARAFPSLDLVASAGRADSAGRSTRPVSTHGLVGAAAWEIDLWGRLAGATELVRANYVASAADAAALRLSAQAMLTQTFLQLRAAERQQTLLESSLVSLQRSLELTRDRYQAGIVGRADVLQAQTQLSNAQVQRAEQQSGRAQLLNALAVLVGVAPSALDLPVEAVLPQAPVVPGFLPSTLLAQRPDIAAARERVVSAFAQIGLAESAYLPSVNLNASLGYRSPDLGRLLSAPSLVWSLGAALASRLIDGGARDAASAQARANADEAVANYRQRVLLALAEVEDGLIAERQLGVQLSLQRAALDSAQAALAIVQAQYEAGSVSYLNVVVAQSSALTAERLLEELQLRRLLAVNGLLRNVAGRWQRPPN